MKSLLISLWLGLSMSLIAQDKPKDDKKVIREVRVLMLAERPAPTYEKRGEEWVEVNPEDKMIPPSFMEVPVSDGEKSKDKKPRSIRLPMNQIVRVAAYDGESAMRMILENPHAKGKKKFEVSATLGELIHPLVILSSDRSGKGWESPNIKVVDVSPQALPSGSAMVVNLSKWPLRVSYADQKQEMATGMVKLTPKMPVKESIDFRVEMKAQEKYVNICSNQYAMGEKDRLFMFVDDANKAIKNVSPLFVRFTTDSIELEKPVEAP